MASAASTLRRSSATIATNLRRSRHADLAHAADPIVQMRAPTLAGSRAEVAATDTPSSTTAAVAVATAAALAGRLVAAEIRACAASQPGSNRSTTRRAGLEGG